MILNHPRCPHTHKHTNLNTLMGGFWFVQLLLLQSIQVQGSDTAHITTEYDKLRAHLVLYVCLSGIWCVPCAYVTHSSIHSICAASNVCRLYQYYGIAHAHQIVLRIISSKKTLNGFGS